jgi:D-glycerate 3-kinase
VNELEAKEDASGQWRQYVNDVLSVDYKRVFASIDYLVMLQAPSFEHVYAWRCEQEHKLKTSLASHRTDSQLPNETMSDSEILRFIQFYQRLTQHALSTIPAKCDRLFVLNETRGITQCQQH